jgi:hypothetical protein
MKFLVPPVSSIAAPTACNVFQCGINACTDQASPCASKCTQCAMKMIPCPPQAIMT